MPERRVRKRQEQSSVAEVGVVPPAAVVASASVGFHHCNNRTVLHRRLVRILVVAALSIIVAFNNNNNNIDDTGASGGGGSGFAEALLTTPLYHKAYHHHYQHPAIASRPERIRRMLWLLPPYPSSRSGGVTTTTTRRRRSRIFMTTKGEKEEEDDDDGDDDGGDDDEFLRDSLSKMKSLEDILDELDEYCAIEGNCEDDDDDEDGDDYDFSNDMFDIEDIDDELISLLQQTKSLGDVLNDVEDDDDDDDDDDDNLLTVIGINTAETNDGESIEKEMGSTDGKGGAEKAKMSSRQQQQQQQTQEGFRQESLALLEKALLGGVVPPDAGVDTNVLPGDFGFDPLGLAEKDYIHQGQYWLLSVLPGGNPNNDPPPGPRPTALVLRDYREAEIRHGRLACLAVIFWPLQEKLDKLLLDEDQYGPLMYGPVTLPYFPLLMTLIMMLLGYLDVYAKSIQEEEQVGDAFLPGDCFWDPLAILQGAPPSMKRNMQERELFNCRMAMLAFAAFVFEEVTSHQPVIDIPSNALLFEPLYQVSFVQEWLDQQFS